MFKDLFGNLLDWKDGKLGKHIAFANIGHVALQQKTICLLQDMLIKNEMIKSKKIAIVSFEVGNGVYKLFIDKGEQVNDTRLNTPNKTNADFIKWSFLINHKIPENFFDQYDVVLWDLPELNTIHEKADKMKNYFDVFSSLIIVSNGQALVSNVEQVTQIKSFFKNHGFHLPKLLNESENEKKVERKTNLRFWT